MLLHRHDVPVGDGTLAAWTTPGRGRPVVLLHGGGLDHRMWTTQVTTLGADQPLVLVDARGHGESSTATTEGYRHCDDLAAVLEALELLPAVVVGVSLGGGTAVDLAIEHPDRVAGVLVSGVGTSEPEFHDPWVLEIFAEWQAAQETRDPERWLTAFLRFVAGPHRSLDDVDPGVVAQVRRMGRDTLEHHAVRHFVPPRPVTRTWERLEQMVIPVTAVSGTLDSPDHVAMAHRLAAAVRDGVTVDIGGAAHYPSLERPNAFDRAVRDLVARAQATPAAG